LVNRQAQRRKRVHAQLDQDRARIIYCVLILQSQSLGATQERIRQALGFSKDKVRRLLAELAEDSYVIPYAFRGAEARILYEVDAITTTTYRDSARFLLEILDYEGDWEGKIEEEKLVRSLLRRRSLKDYNRRDLVGDGSHKGKIDFLVDVSGHLERISPRFIKPRLKARLQRPYLELVAEHPPLGRLRSSKWRT